MAYKALQHGDRRNGLSRVLLATETTARHAGFKADERGFVLVATAIGFLLLLTLAGASVVYSTIDLKSTSHYDTGNQAFAAAESGVLHALSSMNNAGVINFRGDVVDRWSSLYGASRKSMPGYPSVKSEVTLEADAGNPSQQGTIISTGFAPLGARRTVRVGVRRGGNPLTPSVIASGGPSVDDLDRIALNFLSRPGVVTSNAQNFNGNQSMARKPIPGLPI